VAAHFKQHSIPNVQVEDQSLNWHQIALQGPMADSVMSSVLQSDLSSIEYYHFTDLNTTLGSIRISRTGYTGEDGFEVYSSIPDGMKIWESILEQGKGTVLPCGLASRDSLRLEARYPLYGHELNMELTPVESGIGWIVKEKTFQGSERILSDKKNGVSRKVLGFLLDQAGVPREGYSVVDASGQTLGQVLSGGYSPVLKKGMGTALLPASLDQDSIFIEIRGQRIPAHIVKGPFVKGSARSKK
jgi:aminomethyltransferase